MPSIKTSFAPTITWAGGLGAVIIAFILPLIFFTLSYQNQIGSLDAEVEINAQRLSQVIYAPEMWQFDELKLEEFLRSRSRDGQPETRRVFDNDGNLIAQSSNALEPLLLARSADIFYSRGRLEVCKSAAPSAR